MKSVKNEQFVRPALVWPLAAALMLYIVPGCSQKQNGSSPTAAQASPISSTSGPSHANLIGAGAATVITVHGEIVSVDQEKKLVTLEGPNGKQVILHVYNPYNLAAAKVGEPSVAKFYEITTVQNLPPGQPPPSPTLIEGIVSAGPGETPGAAFGGQLQFTVTIDAIDKKDKTISIKGPDGVVETVDVANPEALDQVKVGEQIVVTLTDAAVIALDHEASASANAAPIIDPEVRAVLNRACRELSSARTLTYHAEINFDSVLQSSVKLQYAAEMDTAIRRPNRLAISYKSDLGAKEIWYDGSTLTIYDPAHRVYASTAAPDSIDAMLTQVADEKNLSIPLAGFDFSNPCRRAYGDIQRGKYVGINDVGGVACDHLAFIQRNADWQLWIDHSNKPLPRKIVITHKNVPSQPQWAAVFSKWRFNRKLPASLFQPKIPKGVTMASFMGAQENQQ
jgi:hypothetical protein